MIPVNLKLSNFTSYGESPPELDFTKFKLAAISGLNGAGKSSLLDAITWCVWGSSRAGDSSDDLVKLGQNEMLVEFSFELDGHSYIIKRNRNKKSGGHTSLEFWSGTYNLTEGTIKSTQQKIIETLHLNFETFCNSAYLRQGHADEFTTKGPTDRKRILADILGLDHYDRLEEKAREKTKELQTKLTLLDYQLLEIEAELSQKIEREKKYSLIQQEVEKAKRDVKEIEEIIKNIDQKKQAIEVTVKTLQKQKKQFENLNQEVLDLRLKIDLKEKAAKEYQQILDKKELIETNYQKLLKLQDQKKVLDTKRSELIKVKDELATLEKIINEREDKRKQAISALEVLIKEFETKCDQLANQNKRLMEQKTVCPTCGQPIGAEKNKELIGKNNSEIDKNKAELINFYSKIKKFKSIILPEAAQAKENGQEAKKLELETKDYFEISKQISELDRFQEGYLKLQQAEVAVKTHQETLVDLEKMYLAKKHEFEKAKNSQTDLEVYSEKLAKIQNRLQTQVSTREELNQKLLELTGQEGQAKQLIDRAQQMAKLLKQKSEEKSNLSKEKEAFEELALAFGKKGIQAMIIESAIPEIEEEANNLLDKLTEGRMKVALETQKETKTKVQTLEGKIHATVETLDIIISDEMGERPYELYSGGETFRVNFALRLAISKLLANRAGAKLQFLIIDEGFGTQDATGRAKLVGVIDTIKDDFEKILIITHLEELKEEFPVRIEVSKNPGGSAFEIIGI